MLRGPLLHGYWNGWSQLPADLGSITPPHTIANITELKNRQDFLPHPVFTGIYFHPIFYRPLPQFVQNHLQLFYVFLICDFSIYYAVVSEESNTGVNVPTNIVYVHKKQW